MATRIVTLIFVLEWLVCYIMTSANKVFENCLLLINSFDQSGTVGLW